MRAAVLGAFAFPYPQGSQIFVADHARALVRSGAEVRLFTYGRGVGKIPEDLDCVATPRWCSPKSMRSGPTLSKFPADAGLLATYVRSAGERPFDVAFAHNAEAAMIALAARRHLRTPVIYVAHTLLRHELSAYGPEAFRSGLSDFGGAIDRLIARRADAIVALCEDAKHDFAHVARGPIEVIPPGLDFEPAPSPAEVARACARHELEIGSYALYCGNLDRYQDLELFAQAAASIGRDDIALRFVVATHDMSSVPDFLRGAANLTCVEIDDFAEMRAVIAGSQSVVLCRRRRGGFPIKLLNYMQARKPIVAFEGIAPGFDHMRNAWLLAEGAGSEELADALRALALHESLRDALGAGAQLLLEHNHGWEQLTQQTRTLAEIVVARRSHR